MTDPILSDFVDRARTVSIAEAAPRLKITLPPKGHEHAMPCPQCHGTDRFAVNTKKNVWNCRGCGQGGRDAIGLSAHVHGLDLARREEFLESCGKVLGEDVPEAGEKISDERRAELEAEAAARRIKAEADAERKAAEGNAWRDRERGQARGIYEHAGDLGSIVHPAHYLACRAAIGSAGFDLCRRWGRAVEALSYWHGTDEVGRPLCIHTGPAMVFPFIDASAEMIGCHRTWIDLGNPPKFRPALSDPAKPGEFLNTKKMRGSKTGGLIPVAGDPSATRWVGAEGIENVVAWLSAELEDGEAHRTFYFATGDIGNMAGPASTKGRFGHPEERKIDAKGRERPLMMPSPEPDPERLAEGFPLATHVRELVFLADGDSEPVWTAAHMARAEARARLMVPEIGVETFWPPAGMDWAGVMTGEAA